MTAIDLSPPSATLRVSEVFGPTIQGEGPAAGQAANFVRLMGCNLSCSWCDSAHTWDGSRFSLRDETTLATAEAIVRAVANGPELVVITGGEPLLQQETPAWRALLHGLRETGRTVHVETNGTLAPNITTLTGVDVFVVSPKLPHAGLHRGRQMAALHPWWAKNPARADVHVKVVVRDHDDVAATVRMADAAGISRARTWVMPEGVTAEVLAERWPWVAEAAAEYRINASHRLHVLAWGDERGR